MPRSFRFQPTKCDPLPLTPLRRSRRRAQPLGQTARRSSPFRQPGRPARAGPVALRPRIAAGLPLSRGDCDRTRTPAPVKSEAGALPGSAAQPTGSRRPRGFASPHRCGFAPSNRYYSAVSCPTSPPQAGRYCCDASVPETERREEPRSGCFEQPHQKTHPDDVEVGSSDRLGNPADRRTPVPWLCVPALPRVCPFDRFCYSIILKIPLAPRSVNSLNGPIFL
jgi:hypothetical protein